MARLGSLVEGWLGLVDVIEAIGGILIVIGANGLFLYTGGSKGDGLSSKSDRSDMDSWSESESVWPAESKDGIESESDDADEWDGTFGVGLGIVGRGATLDGL